jgi:hypothetical protein
MSFTPEVYSQAQEIVVSLDVVELEAEHRGLNCIEKWGEGIALPETPRSLK